MMADEERLKKALGLRLGDVVTFLLGATEYTKAETPKLKVVQLYSDYKLQDLTIYCMIDQTQGDPFELSYKDLHTINGKAVDDE